MRARGAWASGGQVVQPVVSSAGGFHCRSSSRRSSGVRSRSSCRISGSACVCSTVSFGLPRARLSICSMARNLSPVGADESSAPTPGTPTCNSYAAGCHPGRPAVALNPGTKLGVRIAIKAISRPQSDHGCGIRLGSGFGSRPPAPEVAASSDAGRETGRRRAFALNRCLASATAAASQ
jgi:hypothetical protein